MNLKVERTSSYKEKKNMRMRRKNKSLFIQNTLRGIILLKSHNHHKTQNNKTQVCDRKQQDNVCL